MPWRGSDQNEESFSERRIPRSLRNHKGHSDRSNSPGGFRTSGILPTLATFVPGASSSTGSHSGDSGVRKTSGLRSRSSSRTNLREDHNSQISNADEALTRGRRRSSSIASTLKNRTRSRGRSAGRSSHSMPGSVPPGPVPSPLPIDGSSRYLEPVSPRSRFNSEDSMIASSPMTTTSGSSTADVTSTTTNVDHSLRHTELPAPASTSKHPENEKVCFMRVYRSDSTFGTIACPLETTTERIIQLASRKFFISDANDYHLVASYPDRVRILPSDSKPAKLIRTLLVSAGYSSDMDKLNAVCRDDTSFSCRIVLCNINEPLRPPFLMQSRKELIVTNTDVSDAPSLVCADPRRVESIDVSGSSFEGTSLHFPRLTKLKMRSSFSPATSSVERVRLCLTNLMGNLTTSDLSGNGFHTLEGLDFEKSPHLRHLDLRGNNLQESPQSLQKLPNLKVSSCGSNALTQFDCWSPSLCQIDLSYNMFELITITDQQAVRMVKLGCLQLCANSLNELPKAIRKLPALKHLDLRHNKIIYPSDCLPETLETVIGSYNKPQMSEHRDSSSNVTGLAQKPDYKGLANIREVKLESIPSSTLPEEFEMGRVKSLNLRNNHLPFIHESLFSSATNLRSLNSSNNHLTRSPSSVKSLQMSEESFVANNSSMDLPIEVFELPELRTLDVHGNNLKFVPAEMLLTPKLKSSNLASNLLTNLPLVSASSPSLVHFVLKDNQSTEDCFETILHFTRLQISDLGYNFLTEIPSGLFAQLPSLEELYLSGNRLVTLPRDDFAQATQLRILAVNSNRLHTLPAEISKATKLEVLDASANQLRYNVANWPFDWNWRWNKKLQYLNSSSNKRLEIRKSHQYVDEEERVVDLADFCILPNLSTLGLMDVTLTTNAIPFQSDTCRVRTFGSDMNSSYRVGIADTLGFRPLANNDLVLERFRNREDESLIASFDGHSEWSSSGNKISHVAQETFGAIFKRELEVPGVSDSDALKNAFLTMHREIGNTALMSPAEISHTTLGHLSATASRLVPADRSSGTGATVLYIKGNKFYIATVGGASVVLSRANGTYSVLSKPVPPVGAELDRVRAAGGIVDPTTSFINYVSPYPRMIGCYSFGTVFSAEPSIYEYEGSTFDPSDQIIIATKPLWQYMRYETAADVARSSSHDPVLASMKIRDFAMAYGCRDRMMAIVLRRRVDQADPTTDQRHSSTELHDNEFSMKKRRQPLPEDSTLARLGSEVSPPFGEVTMVFTDIKSSTYLWENYPSVMRAAIKTHNSLMRRSIRLMDGYEVKNEGDAFIVSFHNPVKALIWCLTVQQHLLTAEWPPELLQVDDCKPVIDDTGTTLFRGLSVRMGIHCGRPVAEPDPVTRRMDYFGPMVNRASRISGIALGGQISISTDFLNMLNRAVRSHKLVQQGVPLEEAYYFTNPSSAVTLDRSVTVLDHTEYVVKELGELKSRGIENPEHIYNVYPAALAQRQKLYDEEANQDQQNKISSNFQLRDQSLSNQQSRLQLHQHQLLEQRRASQLIHNNDDLLGSGSLHHNNSSESAAKGLPTLASFGDAHSAADVSIRKSSGLFESGDNEPTDAYDQERRMSSESVMSSPSLKSNWSSIHNVIRDSWSNKFKLASSMAGTRANTPVPLPPDEYVNEPSQSSAMRLEAVCSTISDENLSSEAARQTLRLIEPPVPAGSDVAHLAQSMWSMRIENAIARLQQLSNWP